CPRHFRGLMTACQRGRGKDERPAHLAHLPMMMDASFRVCYTSILLPSFGYTGVVIVPVIRTSDLVKLYGKIEALKGVTLEVEKGEIFGLLGQNGAGKTTLVKILLGITKATSGEAQLLDKPVGIAAVRERVGFLPEDHRFPDYHTGFSLLDF